MYRLIKLIRDCEEKEHFDDDSLSVKHFWATCLHFPPLDEQGVAMAPVHQSNSFLLKEPPRCPEGPPAVPLRGPLSNLGGMHPPLPPSCIIEELHRALANKLRQDRCVVR